MKKSFPRDNGIKGFVLKEFPSDALISRMEHVVCDSGVPFVMLKDICIELKVARAFMENMVDVFTGIIRKRHILLRYLCLCWQG